MNYNEEFWLEVDSLFYVLKEEINNQAKMFGSDIEMISKIGSNWFTVPITDKIRTLLNNFNFIGIDDVEVSKYTIEDLELLNVKSKFLSELRSVEEIKDKRFLVLFHIKNCGDSDIKNKVRQLLKSLCIFPTLDEMLFNTEALLSNR